jgi:TonB family protein
VDRGPHVYTLCPSARASHPKMASVVTTEFVRTIHADPPPFTLIEQQSLPSRLIQALESAVGELAGDPRGFIRDLLTADTKDAKRRQRIYLGLACALVVHVALIVLIAVIGWRTVFVKQVAAQSQEYTVIFPERVPSIEPPPIENAVASKPEMPKGSGGGGGGGQHTPLPPSQGAPPPMVPGPQIVSMNPSNIPEPTLPFSPSVVGPISPPPPPGPIGDPTGKSTEFSGGPGTGGGIGRGDGPGVGGGKDGGAGTGNKGGRGGGPAGSPNSSPTDGIVDFNRVGSVEGYKSWSWIRRRTAIITPEAQENKVIGTVVLRATFNADGTITDIQVAMPVDFMNESAKEALRRSTFYPATVKGVPVTVRNVLIRIDVHY